MAALLYDIAVFHNQHRIGICNNGSYVVRAVDKSVEMSIIIMEIVIMRKPNIEKTELISRLKKKFQTNEPIFTEEILATWSEYSRPRVFQLLKEFCENGAIVKYAIGVYYLPSLSFWGASLPLSAVKVAEKRYLQTNGQVFGYYSGLTLLNMVGLTNQVPNIREIVTVNEATRVREVTIGKTKFLVRRAKTEITDQNASILQILEIFNTINQPLEKYQTDNILALAGNRQIDGKLATKCAKYYPKRALQNLRNSEIGHVFT